MKPKEVLMLSFGFEISTTAGRAFVALYLWKAVTWGVRLIAAITGASGVRRISVSTRVMPTDSENNVTDGVQGVLLTTESD